MTAHENLPVLADFGLISHRTFPRGVLELHEGPETQSPLVSRSLGATAASELRAYDEAQVSASPTVAETFGISRAEAAALIEQRGYVCPARRFEEQVQDVTRQNIFGYYSDFSVRKSQGRGRMTEHEGLLELRGFLKRGFDELSGSMLKNLTFIGEKEYAEGAAGLADYWKYYLDSDPEAQLCVTTLISGWFNFKSDKYLLERVLEHFTDEELEQYKGRLLVNPKELSAPKEKVRIVLLDDWTVSGMQMSEAFLSALSIGLDKYADQIEINLLTASLKRIENGLEVESSSHSSSWTLPIKAYFLAHSAKGPVLHKENDAYIGGTHSLVDFEFAGPLRNMCGSWLRKKFCLPALVRVSWGYSGYTDRRQYKRVAGLTGALEE